MASEIDDIYLCHETNRFNFYNIVKDGMLKCLNMLPEKKQLKKKLEEEKKILEELEKLEEQYYLTDDPRCKDIRKKRIESNKRIFRLEEELDSEGDAIYDENPYVFFSLCLNKLAKKNTSDPILFFKPEFLANRAFWISNTWCDNPRSSLGIQNEQGKQPTEIARIVSDIHHSRLIQYPRGSDYRTILEDFRKDIECDTQVAVEGQVDLWRNLFLVKLHLRPSTELDEAIAILKLNGVEVINTYSQAQQSAGRSRTRNRSRSNRKPKSSRLQNVKSKKSKK